MNKTIKFEMPERDPDENEGAEESSRPGIVIEVEDDPKDESGGQSSLFRSRWNELQKSRQPKPLWRSAAGSRLVVLVVVLGMVIWAMSKAGKPESWNWLFKLEQARIANSQPENGKAVEGNASGLSNIVKIDSKGDQANQSEAGTDDEEKAEDEAPLQFNTTGSTERIEVDFWRSFLRSLSGKQQVRLFWLLDSVTHKKELPTGQTSVINPVLKKLVNRRQQFHRSLVESGNKNAAIRENWTNKFLPALRDSLLGEKQIEESIRSEFLQTIDYVRRAADSLVEDKTAIERPKDSFAWFAAWSDVFDAPMDAANGQDATVTQLLAQPEAYRGKWISIKGTVLQMDKIEASTNPLGIERYYVLWVKPDHPSSFPFCVYSLMAPDVLVEAFEAKDAEVNLPITASGRFFKNRIFASDQPAFAPVLMTANVREVKKNTASSDSKFTLPSSPNIVLWLGIIGGFAFLVAWSVFRSTLGSAARSLPKSNFLADSFSELEEDERVETTREKLQRLSETALHQPPDDANDSSEGSDNEQEGE